MLGWILLSSTKRVRADFGDATRGSTGLDPSSMQFLHPCWGGAYPKAAPISRAASWPARDTLDGRLCRADRAAIELAAISLGLNHSFELVHVNEHTIETWQIHRLGLALTDGVVDVSG